MEENLELRNTLPFHVKRLENENLKAEIHKYTSRCKSNRNGKQKIEAWNQTLQDAKDIATENENLKAEIRHFKDAKDIATIK